MLGEAISHYFKGREFSCGETIDSIQWHDSLPAPSNEDIEAAVSAWPSEKLKQGRRTEILAELEAIDFKSIRPLRAGDQARVDELEAQAVALRAELAAL